MEASLKQRLRLIVVTDPQLAGPRGVVGIVRAALAAGAPAVQLRDKIATARELAELARLLLPDALEARALLFINDRLDVALAAGAHGVHLGPDDIPVADARRISPPELLIGFSTDAPDRARRAQADGASYIGCGAVFGTTTKQGLRDERIGTARLDEVARGVGIPVVGIGGISEANIHEVAATGASGAAVVGAVMQAEDVAGAVRRLLGVWG